MIIWLLFLYLLCRVLFVQAERKGGDTNGMDTAKYTGIQGEAQTDSLGYGETIRMQPELRVSADARWTGTIYHLMQVAGLSRPEE